MDSSIRIAVGFIGTFLLILSVMGHMTLTIMGIVCGLALLFIALDPREGKA